MRQLSRGREEDSFLIQSIRVKIRKDQHNPTKTEDDGMQDESSRRKVKVCNSYKN